MSEERTARETSSWPTSSYSSYCPQVMELNSKLKVICRLHAASCVVPADARPHSAPPLLFHWTRGTATSASSTEHWRNLSRIPPMNAAVSRPGGHPASQRTAGRHVGRVCARCLPSCVQAQAKCRSRGKPCMLEHESKRPRREESLHHPALADSLPSWSPQTDQTDEAFSTSRATQCRSKATMRGGCRSPSKSSVRTADQQRCHQ
mmetsp:Transcript_8899/g.19574  ORF Transcript_8899/g.19574 Transcript_8899/m.19574 type:complete len:205 (-) Transcript_8899:997-1611(-)